MSVYAPVLLGLGGALIELWLKDIFASFRQRLACFNGDQRYRMWFDDGTLARLDDLLDVIFASYFA